MTLETIKKPDADVNGYTMSSKRLEHLASVDAMPHALRECVHEFGLPIVRTLVKFGINDPRHIREIVREIWLGPRQEGQRTGALTTLDVLMARGPVSSKMLLRFLADNHLAIVSMVPTRAMLDASIAEVSGGNVRCTREEKHKRRLEAAIRAGAYR